MSFTIAFYVHHHGSGHLMRTMQIVNALKGYQVILMGSGLNKIKQLPPHVWLVHLPLDIPEENEKVIESSLPPTGLHYAPLGIQGSRDRVAIMTDVFRSHYPLILVVDVSVEVALLARLAGIPTIIIRQHGKRNDLAHELAYNSAELLIAPFAKSMYIGEEDHFFKKTFFAGGFSKFDQTKNDQETDPKMICILVGKGGTSINPELLQHIAKSCPSYHFNVMGLTNRETHDLKNLQFHGEVNDPAPLIGRAMLVIGNTGHNTVMEMASLNKRFIGIPEARPFEEQLEKAKSIEGRSGILIIHPQQLYHTNWADVFEKISTEEPDWKDVIHATALSNVANAIINTGKKFF